MAEEESHTGPARQSQAQSQAHKSRGRGPSANPGAGPSPGRLRFPQVSSAAGSEVLRRFGSMMRASVFSGWLLLLLPCGCSGRWR